MQQKKKPFLLLEVLIALLLISLCLPPLIGGPIRAYQKEMRLLEAMERERLADGTFLEIKEKLLKNEIPWEKIPSPGTLSDRFPLPPATLHIPGAKKHSIQRSFQLKCGKKGEKEGIKQEIYRMIDVLILFDPPLPEQSKNPPHSYPVLVRRLPKDPG